MLNLPARTRKVPLFRGAGKEGNKKMLAGGVGFEPTLVCLTGRGLATRLLTHGTHHYFALLSLVMTLCALRSPRLVMGRVSSVTCHSNGYTRPMGWFQSPITEYPDPSQPVALTTCADRTWDCHPRWRSDPATDGSGRTEPCPCRTQSAVCLRWLRRSRHR